MKTATRFRSTTDKTCLRNKNNASTIALTFPIIMSFFIAIEFKHIPFTESFSCQIYCFSHLIFSNKKSELAITMTGAKYLSANGSSDLSKVRLFVIFIAFIDYQMDLTLSIIFNSKLFVIFVYFQFYCLCLGVQNIGHALGVVDKNWCLNLVVRRECFDNIQTHINLGSGV